ncbi:MAG: alpha-1,4-glucan--maltose-1-phosphate maltosyltransferase [Candidatus Omnitrophota bacterium]
MDLEDRKRVVIENARPEINGGRFPIKRVVGEKVVVQADIFADGHDELGAYLLFRKAEEKEWHQLPMRLLVNDRWQGGFFVREIGTYYYTFQGWVDRFKTWQKDLAKMRQAGQDIKVALLIGAEYIEQTAKRASRADREKLREWAGILKNQDEADKAVSAALSEELTKLMDAYPDTTWMTTYEKELGVVVEREKALFSAWYEVFPRSCSPEPGKHGTLKDCERLLPEIAQMGFDIVYLSPVHPIGKSCRKGKNNSPDSASQDPGSPWAIGSDEGGHKSIHPQLGTMQDFQNLVAKAKDYGLEVAMDLAFQCSRGHPYVKQHPEWFLWRPDGTIQFAENPPKKYEDIVPFNFETESSKALWNELKSIVLFWIDKGIRIFRADNPHTKPFAFWEWLISEIKKDYPDVIFLSEAFTRPKVMYRLAKAGFSQSYTYFTWRNTKREFMDYLTELTQTEVVDYFRPNFWPNTPDILPEFLQYGGRPAFIIKFILTATLSSSYGIFGPAFELCVNEALPGKEEYLNSEKYEIKHWDRDQPGNLKDLISRVNRIRKENPAFCLTRNLRFYEADNDYLLFYAKATENLSNVLLIVVNLDPYHTQSGWVRVPLSELGIDPNQPYLVHDLISEDKYVWQGERNYVELNPSVMPVHILRVNKRLRREVDFDYFM